MRPGAEGPTHCPAHDDRHPSLSVHVRDGRVLRHCQAGCAQDAVTAALRARYLLADRRNGHRPEPKATKGVDNHRSHCETVKPNVRGCETAVNARETRARQEGQGHEASERDADGLTLTTLAKAKRLPPEFLRRLGLHDARYRGRPAVAIPYLDESGTEVARRFRLSLAGDQRFAWQKGARVMPYGLQRLAEARRAGWVLIVEGESDCWTAWHHGLPALGVPGKAVWRAEWAAHLAGLDVVIWQESDAEDFSVRLGRDLPQARVIVAPEGIKDVSDAHLAGRDVPALVAELRERARPVADFARAVVDAETRRLREAAAPVLAEDDPLQRVAEALRAQGYGGDLTPALVTYLCVTTRLLAMRHGAMPAHLLLVGPPSAGKSYTLQSVLRLLPREAYHTIDAGSPRVLIYDDADLQHRAVVFSEADSLPAGEDNPAASAVRNLLQDHRLHYAVTVRDPDTGQFTVREVAKDGPSVLVTTAVCGLGGQLGTRMFTLPVPEGVQKVRQALTTQAELELAGAAEPDEALIAFQAYLQRLAPIDVKVPFALELAAKIGQSASATRILRDFARLIALIKAVAVLRQAHRERDANGAILATVEDYATVFELVGAMYEATLSGATEAVRMVVAAVRDLRAAGEEPVTYSAVARRVGLHPEQVKRLVRVAANHEWLVNRAEGRHKPADLDVGEPLPERAGLPTAEELRAAKPVAHPAHPTPPPAAGSGCTGFHTSSRDFTAFHSFTAPPADSDPTAPPGRVGCGGTGEAGGATGTGEADDLPSGPPGPLGAESAMAITGNGLPPDGGGTPGTDTDEPPASFSSSSLCHNPAPSATAAPSDSRPVADPRRAADEDLADGDGWLPLDADVAGEDAGLDLLDLKVPPGAPTGAWPDGPCPRCGYQLHRLTCWRCKDSICLDCGVWTGSGLRTRCMPCGTKADQRARWGSGNEPGPERRDGETGGDP